jgi:hypothetical protein
MKPIEILQRYPIRSPLGAMAIAKLHKTEEMEAHGNWTCQCRCCLWSAINLECAKKAKGATS